MTRSELSILSEWRVACDRAVRLGEKLLAHRESFAGVEIDLLLDSGREGLSLIEVKTTHGDLWAYHPVKIEQRRRLDRACAAVEDQYRRPVALIVAAVSAGGSIEYFEA